MKRAHVLTSRLAREPVLHFILLGVAIFGAHRLLAPPPRERIVLDADALAALRLDHQRRAGAPPTAAEERALVDRYVEDEILYREALALGLDRGDIIVRRRLVQKMEHLIEAGGDDAAEAEARQACLAGSPERYRLPATVSLEHVFFHDEAAARDGAARLAAGADPARLGEPFVRGRILAAATPEQVEAALGPAIAALAGGLAEGAWSAPVRSPHGWHLVRINARDPGRVPAPEEVAGRAEIDCERDAREARAARALAELRTRYQVAGR